MINYVKPWENYRIELQKRMRLTNGLYSLDDITYYMHFREFTDHSLLYDHSIFEFKPPKILCALMASPIHTHKKLMSDLILFETKALKSQKLNDVEFLHLDSLKSIIRYTLKCYSGAPKEEQRKIIAGDYKEKTHF